MAWLLWVMTAIASPLQLPTVLEAVDERLPELAAAQAKLEATEAKLLAASGAFDPKLKAKGASYQGKYPRTVLDTELQLPTPYGPAFSVGYQRGVGDFPSYGTDYETPESGSWVAKVEVPLLEGLVQSPERAKRDAARWNVEATQWALAAKEIAVRQKATEAYWKWVAAGAKLRVDAELLAVAERRAAALGRQVEEGARSELDRLDNERVLFERVDAVAQSTAMLEVSAQVLSLYYRDREGRPLIMEAAELPLEFPTERLARALDEDLAAASTRPELRALEDELRSIEAQAKAARSAKLPELLLVIGTEQPIDGSTPQSVAGVDLSFPLLNRKDRGSYDALTAQVRGLEAELGGRRDLVRAEVLAAHARLRAARERVDATTSGWERAKAVVQMEQRRVTLGGADMFKLLVREEYLAKAAKAAVEAQLAAKVAEAELDALTGAPRRSVQAEGS